MKLTDDDSIANYQRTVLSRNAYKAYEEGKPGEVVTGEQAQTWLPPWKVKMHFMYECEFKKALQSDPDMMDFFTHHYKSRPLRRLVPRRALYSPVGEVRQLHWKAEPGSDYELVKCARYKVRGT